MLRTLREAADEGVPVEDMTTMTVTIYDDADGGAHTLANCAARRNATGQRSIAVGDVNHLCCACFDRSALGKALQSWKITANGLIIGRRHVERAARRTGADDRLIDLVRAGVRFDSVGDADPNRRFGVLADTAAAERAALNAAIADEIGNRSSLDGDVVQVWVANWHQLASWADGSIPRRNDHVRLVAQLAATASHRMTATRASLAYVPAAIAEKVAASSAAANRFVEVLPGITDPAAAAVSGGVFETLWADSGHSQWTANRAVAAATALAAA